MARSKLKPVLLVHAQALRNAGAVKPADVLASLADAVAPKGILLDDIDAHLRLDKTGTDVKISVNDHQPAVESVLGLVRDLNEVMKVAAKKDVLADLGRLTSFLERHRTMSLTDLLACLANSREEPDLVALYATQLSAVFGEDGFESLLNSVSADRRIKQGDLIAIAEAMGKPVGTRPSKKKVIEHLLYLHNKLADFKAKQRAMAGRSAA